MTEEPRDERGLDRLTRHDSGPGRIRLLRAALRLFQQDLPGVETLKKCVPLVMILGLGFFTAPSSAGIISVSGALTSMLDADNANYDTSITLSNSNVSTDGVGTFWLSWVPQGGKDFMANNPISETTPSGWTAKVTHGGATDGYAIQWVANSAANDLAPDSSLVFQFKSAETPAQLAGNSAAFPTFPEGTSFVYSGVRSRATANSSWSVPPFQFRNRRL
jgi:hypothetical protein